MELYKVMLLSMLFAFSMFMFVFVIAVIIGSRIISNHIVSTSTKYEIPKTNIVNPESNTCNDIVCNDSIQKRMTTGEIEKVPFETSVNATTCSSENKQPYEGGMQFYKKYKPYDQIYTADDPREIMGSNYMEQDNKPNPYHLDFRLYDKTEKQHVPVGINYAIIV